MLFTADLRFTGELRDQVLQRGCLSADDCEMIDGRASFSDQVRLLVKKLKSRGPMLIKAFLDILNEDAAYQHLVTKVYASFDRLKQETPDRARCVVCVVRSTVDVKDVGDQLWESKAISDDVWDRIVEVDNVYSSREVLWDEIFAALNSSDDFEKKKEILTKSIESKYPDIVQYIKSIPVNQKLSCCCMKRRRLRRGVFDHRFSGSVSDVSTTSEMHGGNIPSRDLLWDSSTDSDADRPPMPDLGSSFSSEHSFAKRKLDHYDSIGSSKASDETRLKQLHFDHSDSYGSSKADDETRPKKLNLDSTGISRTKIKEITNDPNEKSDRSRCQSGAFTPDKNYVDAEESFHSLPICLKQGSKHDIHRSISRVSNVTLQAPSSNSGNESADTAARSSLTDVQSPTIDGFSSPDFKPGRNQELVNQTSVQTPTISINQETDTIDTLDTASKGLKEVPSSSTLSNVPTFKPRPTRRHLSESDGVFADDDNDAHNSHPKDYNIHFRRRKKHRETKERSNVRRQESQVPWKSGKVITRSVSKEDKHDPKIGLMLPLDRRSKKSKQRQLRRQKSLHDRTDSENQDDFEPLPEAADRDRGMKAPHNPMIDKVPRPRQGPNWDYNQALRYRKMCRLQFMAEHLHATSDTDNVTEESSITGFSDFTV